MQKPGRFGKMSPQCARQKRILSANLATDSVLLLIERLMLVLCDVTAVKSRHRALLVAYRAVFPMKLFGLLFGDLAFLQLMIDPSVLIRQPVIDLVAPRVIALPLCFGKGRGHGAPSQRERNNESNGFD
jgi:hypothetical protein